MYFLWGSVIASSLPFQVQAAPPGYDMGPNTNFVAVPFSAAAIASPPFQPVIGTKMGWYQEDLPAGYELAVPELYSAMLARRLELMGGPEAALQRQKPS